MKRYLCNGKKGYCDRGNDNNIDCRNCEFADGSGGKVVDVPNTNYERIRNMSVEEMAKELVRARMQLDEDGFDYDIIYSTSDRKVFINYEEALKHQKQWLESEVTEE